jgi:hypothetical protein
MIEGFEQIANIVNEDNFERLMTDFMLAFQFYMGQVKAIRQKYPKETDGLENWDIAKYHFEWIDDGKHDMKSVTITDSKTGETITKKL